MRRIVLFELGWIGDTIVTIPAMRSVRETFPDAEITRICSPPAEPILRNCPYINHLFIYDRDGKHKGMRGGFRLLRTVRGMRPDIFVNLHVPDVNRSFKVYFRDNLFSLLTGATMRVGYYCPMTGLFLTHGIKVSGKHLSRYIVDLINDLPIRLGCDPKHDLELWINDDDRRGVTEFLRQHGVRDTDSIIAINPGAKRKSKRWPISRFTEIARWLGEKAKIVVTGSKDEIDLAGQMVHAFPHIITGSGVLTLMETAALLERCKLLITNDTGIMHVALALGVPIVGLFGPANIERWVLSDSSRIKVIHHPVPCSPCYRWECEDLSCMKAITVDEVKEAVLHLTR